MRRLAPVLAVLALLAFAPARASEPIAVAPIDFSVSNLGDPAGAAYTVHGRVYRPSAALDCSNTVVLLVHGLSYGIYAWDFPGEPERYSVARALAARGYPSVAVDLPGYGADSTKPRSGYQVSVPAYASMVAQIATDLRASRGFRHVVLMGHSAGTEIVEHAQALYASGDALVATGYTHFPSARILTDFVTGDYARATASDYEYFGGTEAVRTEYMFNAAVADPDIVARDNALARLTPSGEIYSMGPQPSRALLPQIQVPVLGVFGEKDLLFPAENADQELLLFAGTSDKSKLVAENAGHSFMLHPSARDTNSKIADWLDAHQSAATRCPN
jgi:pimeloyl-ACP methyl ester carboxylesterase